MDCPVCGEFQQLGPQLEAHVNAHFTRNDPWAAGSAPDDPEVIDLTGDDDASASAAALPRFAPVDVSRLPLGTRPEPSSPACIHAAIRRALLAQRGENAIFRAALCGPPLLHYSGVRGLDAGWGCGFRNIQMLCAHLLGRPEDARGAALFGGSGQLPDVGCLQAWLERAWSLGFDPDGTRHFGGVIQGTSRWIGAGECAALLRSFGLHAKVITFKAAGSGGADAGQPVAQCDGCGVVPIRAVRYRSKSISDYDLCGACHASRADLVATCGPFVSIPIPAQAQAPQNDPVHGDACAPGSHQALLDWLWKYFTTAEQGQNAAPWLLGCQVYTSSTRHPVFLQHDGHSVTVVGVERRPSRGSLGGRDVGREGGSEQFTLLVLDPAVNAAALSANLASLGQWPRLLKRGAHTLLKRREYQVVYVDPVPVPLHAAVQTLAILEETPPDSVFA